jgi:hypothetical protein
VLIMLSYFILLLSNGDAKLIHEMLSLFVSSQW